MEACLSSLAIYEVVKVAVRAVVRAAVRAAVKAAVVTEFGQTAWKAFRGRKEDGGASKV